MRHALFAIGFGLVSIVMFAVAALGEWLSRGFVFAARRRWALIFVALARALLGIRLRITGTVPRRGLVAAKHQSLYETIALMTVLDQPAVILKSELARLPFWRFLVRRAGSVAVDRTASSAALRAMIAGARAADVAGRPILLFPEGTRVPPGEAPSLRPGMAGLYRALGGAVTPLALDSGRCWPTHGFATRPGTVTLAFGTPIAPGLPRAAFEALLHAALNAAPS